MDKIEERVRGIDVLRGILMFIGIFYHAAFFNFTYHAGGKYTSLFFFFIKDFTHNFRMPLFFFISGYFGSLNFKLKGAKNFISERIKRILIPFIVALFVICPLTAI